MSSSGSSGANLGPRSSGVTRDEETFSGVRWVQADSTVFQGSLEALGAMRRRAFEEIAAATETECQVSCLSTKDLQRKLSRALQQTKQLSGRLWLRFSVSRKRLKTHLPHYCLVQGECPTDRSGPLLGQDWGLSMGRLRWIGWMTP